MKKIGRYEIIEKIGEGGMGTVWKARHPSLGRIVALKEIIPQFMKNEELLGRFKQEAMIMSDLSDYSHVVQVFDLEEAEGKLFYTMEYIPKSLAEHIGESGPVTDSTRVHRTTTAHALPAAEAEEIIRQVLMGLDVIHKVDVIHRDICPRNVMLKEKDGRFDAKLTDFGIAGQRGSKLTRTGMSYGKEDYAAPEQLDDLKNATSRSDLYSVGVLAYRLTTGRMPKGRFKDPAVINPEVRPEFNDAILKCMEQEPQDRFESAEAMLAVLRESKAPGSTRGTTGKQTDIKDSLVVKSTPFDNLFTGLDFFPGSSPTSRYQLRSTPKTVDPNQRSKEFGLNDEGKPLLYIQNDYKDNGNGTVMDHATGLMWQQSGSDAYMTYDKAESYIRALNQSCFAGYSDWRLPTIPELMSLLEPSEKIGSLYIDTVFDSKQPWCWSCDKWDSGSAWNVFFSDGGVGWRFRGGGGLYVRAVRSGQ